MGAFSVEGEPSHAPSPAPRILKFQNRRIIPVSLKEPLMSKQLVTVIFAVLLIILGGHDILTRRGSAIGSTFFRSYEVRQHLPHYTGVLAVGEGLIFIGAGIFLIHRAWKNSAADDD